MKTLLLMLSSLLLLGLGGCATQPEAAAQYPPDLRSKYIHAIEKDADSRFTRVYWVKAPSNQEIQNRLKIEDDD